jgi:hypothetical protein
MNYNLIAYFSYLSIICFITVYVGWLFYSHGKLHLLRLLNNDDALTTSINKLLLTGYYLLNIGYAILTLRTWGKITSINQLIYTVASNAGTIIFFLGCMHYFNLWATTKLAKKLTHNI